MDACQLEGEAQPVVSATEPVDRCLGLIEGEVLSLDSSPRTHDRPRQVHAQVRRQLVELGHLRRSNRATQQRHRLVHRLPPDRLLAPEPVGLHGQRQVVEPRDTLPQPLGRLVGLVEPPRRAEAPNPRQLLVGGEDRLTPLRFARQRIPLSRQPRVVAPAQLGQLAQQLRRVAGPVGRDQQAHDRVGLPPLAIEASAAQVEQALGLGPAHSRGLAVVAEAGEVALAPLVEGGLDGGPAAGVGVGAQARLGRERGRELGSAGVVPGAGEHVGLDRADRRRLGVVVGQGEAADGEGGDGHERGDAPAEQLAAALAEHRVELGEEAGHVGPALARLDREAAQDRGPQRGGDRAVGRDRADVALAHGEREAVEGLAGERPLAEQRLVGDHAEAELIGEGAAGLAAELLRGHVRGRAHDRAGPGQAQRRRVDLGLGVLADRVELGPGGVADQAEVEHAEAPVGADHRVVGLEVAVDEASRVGGLEPGSGLAEHRQDLPPVPAGLGRFGLVLLGLGGPLPVRRRQPVAQALAGDELHRHEQVLVVAAELVDLDDVGVREPGEGLGLALEPELGGHVGDLAQQQLDGDLAVEALVVAGVDDAHAAAAELADDRVTTDATGADLGGAVGEVGVAGVEGRVGQEAGRLVGLGPGAVAVGRLARVEPAVEAARVAGLVQARRERGRVAGLLQRLRGGVEGLVQRGTPSRVARRGHGVPNERIRVDPRGGRFVG